MRHQLFIPGLLEVDMKFLHCKVSQNSHRIAQANPMEGNTPVWFPSCNVSDSNLGIRHGIC